MTLKVANGYKGILVKADYKTDTLPIARGDFTLRISNNIVGTYDAYTLI